MHGHYDEVIGYVGGITEDLRRVLTRLDPRRIAVNYSLDDAMADGLTHGMFLKLGSALAGTPYPSRVESAERIVAALRGRKSATEQERIRAACQATEQMFRRLTPRLRVGLSEKQVAAFLREDMERDGDLAPAWDADHCPAVFTGPDSAGAHAGPTDRLVEPGHVMNVDFGVRKDGYCSDLQRTWYFLRSGEERAPDAVVRGFETIVEAIRRAAAVLVPGRKGGEVDRVARSFLTDRGYPEFPHALGHQIGRTAHDGAGLLCPRWERYGSLPDLAVEPGQCYTIEPRLPIPGHGIATCEEIYAVTPDGARALSTPQTELLVVPSEP
jgi:Xaa-Pro aminopeptidase